MTVCLSWVLPSCLLCNAFASTLIPWEWPLSPPCSVYISPAPSVTYEICWLFHLVNVKLLLQDDVFVHKHKCWATCLLYPWQQSVIKQILLCLRVWAAVYPARSGKKTLNAGILIKEKRGTCPWNVVETDLGLLFLSLTWMKGLERLASCLVFPRDFLSVMISIQLFAFFRRERALLQDD